jgi:hypothetical protein
MTPFAAHTNATRTTDSTDRTPALRTGTPSRQPKSGRLGQATKRFLSALMRSLAAPHV